MKIEEIKPAIRQFKFRQEETDPQYGSCLWATFTMDTENYTLYIESDCGNYAYGWTPTPKTESFIELMSRVNEDYLLGKIAEEECFNFAESKEQTIANIKQWFEYEPDEEKETEIMSEINYRIYNTGDQDDFYHEIDEILEDYEIPDAHELIHIEMDYSARAKRITKIFCEVLQPVLKEECRKGAPTITPDFEQIFKAALPDLPSYILENMCTNCGQFFNCGGNCLLKKWEKEVREERKKRIEESATNKEPEA